jgi:hypothetical protein
MHRSTPFSILLCLALFTLPVMLLAQESNGPPQPRGFSGGDATFNPNMFPQVPTEEITIEQSAENQFEVYPEPSSENSPPRRMPPVGVGRPSDSSAQFGPSRADQQSMQQFDQQPQSQDNPPAAQAADGATMQSRQPRFQAGPLTNHEQPRQFQANVLPQNQFENGGSNQQMQYEQEDHVRLAAYQQNGAVPQYQGQTNFGQQTNSSQNANNAIVATDSQTDSRFAHNMIQQALTPAGENLLPGKAISLKDAVGKQMNRSSRLAIVKDYWKLAVALTDFQFATEEVESLTRVAAPKSGEARALWQAEIASAEARVAEAKLASIDAQETLRQKLGLSGEELPLPQDVPWVGRYRTNFDEYQTAGYATENLKRIDRVLPVMWQLVQRRARAVEASQIAFNELTRVYQSGSLPVGDLLDMHRRLRDQRINFLAAVRDYNFSIADYAMSTVNANGGADQVAAMLLFDATLNLDQVEASPIRQASAAGNNNSVTLPGQTFVPGATVRPSSNFNGSSSNFNGLPGQ